VKYQHYKGGIYKKVMEVKHTETGESLVVYEGRNGKWARPKKMFYENVIVDGIKVRRFKPIYSNNSNGVS
jgi:hypothetical protein